MSGSGRLGAAGLLLFAAVAWGGMFPVAIETLHVLDPFHLTALRYGITALIFVALLALVEGPRALRTDGRAARVAALGATGFAGFGLLVFLGLEHSRPEHGAIIMATQPLVAAVAAWWLRGTRLSRATVACLAAALVGVVLVVTKGRWSGLFSGGTGWGDLLIFLGAVSWVIYSLGASEFPAWSPLRYTALTCILAVPAIFALTVIATVTGHARMPDVEQIASVHWQLAYVIVLSSVLAVLAWNSGMRRLGAADGMLFINFVPVTAFAIGIAQGHRFGVVELAGALLVCGALVMNNVLARRAAPTASPARGGKSLPRGAPVPSR